MRSPTVGNPFRTRLRFGLQSHRRRSMLIAFVQRIVSAFDEYFSPLDEAGRGEAGDHANDDFLDERRVHWQLQGAEGMPWAGGRTYRQNPFGLLVEWLRFPSMHSNGDVKHEPDDPENAVRMLELELLRQRAVRQKAGAPYRGLRAASFIFFFAVVLGALLAFYYVFFSGALDQVSARHAPKPSSSLAPSASSTP
jgi:hypothetical protein